MNAESKTTVFKKRSTFSNSSDRYLKSKYAEKEARMTLLISDMYLWIHGIGFTEKMSCRGKSAIKTIISIIFLIIAEGNLAFELYGSYKLLRKDGIVKNKETLASAAIIILNAILRYLFYTQRKLLMSTGRKLAGIYARVGNEGTSFGNFRVKLIIMLVLHEAYIIGYAFCGIYFHVPPVASVEQPYSVLKFHLSDILTLRGLTSSVLASYFCSYCIVLRESMLALKRRLLTERSTDELLELYGEILETANDVNTLLHPFLIPYFVVILSIAFRQSYMVLFLWKGLEAPILFFSMSVTFSYFVLVCMFSSSVMRASKEVKVAAQKSTAISSVKRLQFFFQLIDEFPGFKILDSIVIDSSLILSALGALLSYGILIATFQTNKKV